jgi:hypothetical protein
VLLSDEFFLLAHDDSSGRPRLHHRAVGLGLAAGLLGELILLGRITADGGGVAVLDRQPPAEPTAHLVLDQLIVEPAQHPVRIWLAYLAESSTDAVGGRLERAGHVTRTASRRLLRSKVFYVPVDMSTAAMPTVRLRIALSREEQLTQQDALLGGLATATGLGPDLLRGCPPHAAKYLTWAMSMLPTPMRELLAETQAAVGNAVLSHRS